MPTRRHYVNNAPQQLLSAQITSGALSLTVPSFAGWPTQFPFFGTLELGTVNEEIVSVTNIVGSTATIVRGQDGSTAISHLAGATFDFTVVSLDLDEANAHTSSNSGVHGVSGNVVGTSDVQTLSNKTLSAPTVTGTLAGASETLSGTLSVSGTSTLAGVNASGAVAVAGALTATAAGTGLAVTNNETVGGTLAVTGAVTGASFTASGNGAVTGLVVPKSYANQAAAPASPATGTIVYLTAPTGGYPAGPFQFNGSIYLPLNPGSVRFRATTKSATAITANANIPYVTIAEDTASGWNSTNKNWVCPLAGTYLYSCQVKWGSAPASAGGVGIFQNGVAVANSANAGNVSFQGPAISGYLRLALNDTVASQSTNAYTTQVDTGDNNFLELVWLGY